ncbi:helix-turn-helix transcriptional regulator (plasmid) [Rossellomorea sp. AcN35-11]|nr:helix-turn-helix transcriptional regulator [Rossellomorea sp. AcN35-11]
MSNNQNIEVNGEKIRKLRKEKHMTLKELAEGICSLGKMSNIENGKTDPTPTELSAIAERLRVMEQDLQAPPFTISAQYRNKYDKWMRQAEEIESLLQLGLLNESKRKLEEFSNEATDVEDFFFITNFLWACYYNKIGETEKSVETINVLIKSNPKREIDGAIQIRAKNLLCSILLKDNEKEKVATTLKEITDAVFRRKAYQSEVSKVKFNLTVFLIIKGDYDLARMHAESLSNVQDYEYITTFLLAVIDFYEGDLISSMDRAFLVKKKSRDMGLNDLLLRVLVFEYFLNFMFVGQEAINKESVNKAFEDLMKIVMELPPEFRNLAVYSMNVLISVSLRRDNPSQMDELSKNLLSMMDGSVHNSLQSQSYLYLSKVSLKRNSDKSGCSELHT